MSTSGAKKAPFKIPVLTAERPPLVAGITIIGVVAVSGEWNVPFAVAIEDLAARLAERAVEQFPNARMLYNMRWWAGAGHYGHTWYDGSADAYTFEVKS